MQSLYCAKMKIIIDCWIEERLEEEVKRKKKTERERTGRKVLRIVSQKGVVYLKRKKRIKDWKRKARLKIKHRETIKLQKFIRGTRYSTHVYWNRKKRETGRSVKAFTPSTRISMGELAGLAEEGLKTEKLRVELKRFHREGAHRRLYFRNSSHI